MEAIMIFKVEKRHFRKNGELQTTRGYYLRYRIGDMPVDRWKSLGATDLQVANKKAQEFIKKRSVKRRASLKQNQCEMLHSVHCWNI